MYILNPKKYITSYYLNKLHLKKFQKFDYIVRKKYILNQRKKIVNLNYRLINGNWIRGLNNIPSLKGMLYKLNNKKHYSEVNEPFFI